MVAEKSPGVACHAHLSTARQSALTATHHSKTPAYPLLLQEIVQKIALRQLKLLQVVGRARGKAVLGRRGRKCTHRLSLGRNATHELALRQRTAQTGIRQSACTCSWVVFGPPDADGVHTFLWCVRVASVLPMRRSQSRTVLS